MYTQVDCWIPSKLSTDTPSRFFCLSSLFIAFLSQKVSFIRWFFSSKIHILFQNDLLSNANDCSILRASLLNRFSSDFEAMQSFQGNYHHLDTFSSNLSKTQNSNLLNFRDLYVGNYFSWLFHNSIETSMY